MFNGNILIVHVSFAEHLHFRVLNKLEGNEQQRNASATEVINRLDLFEVPVMNQQNYQRKKKTIQTNSSAKPVKCFH